MGGAEEPCSPRQVTHVHTEAESEENNAESVAVGAHRTEDISESNKNRITKRG